MVSRFSSERFVAGKAALLFVDMQPVWVHKSGAGAQRIEDTSDKLYYYSRIAQYVIPNQVQLLSAARRSGVQVIHTIIQSVTDDGRDRSRDHKLSGIHIRKDFPDGRIIEELSPEPNEIVIAKTSSGVFNSTNIDYVLRNIGVLHLIVCGVVTDQCVDMAVRDAADRGYIAAVVEDACAAYSEQRHDAAIASLSAYADIIDTNAALNIMREDSRP